MSATPLCRWIDWYEGLSDELRAHLDRSLFSPGLPWLDGRRDPRRTRVTEVGSRLEEVASRPEREAELLAVLVARTDLALADAVLRERWIATSRERAAYRTMEWMRAAEHWSLLRETTLAFRRIERWMAKRGVAAAS
jgi:hypothetical protein